MARLKSIMLTVENIALGDVLDKLDGMPGVIAIDLKLKSEKALVAATPATAERNPRPARDANYGKTQQGIGIQEAVLGYLEQNGPTHVDILSRYIGEKDNKRIYSCTYNLKKKHEVRLVDTGTYEITTTGRKRLPLQLQANPEPKALPKPKIHRKRKSASRGILLKALSDGAKRTAELAAALEAGGLSAKSIRGRVMAAQMEGIVKSNNGLNELTAKGVKEAAALQQEQGA